MPLILRRTKHAHNHFVVEGIAQMHAWVGSSSSPTHSIGLGHVPQRGEEKRVDFVGKYLWAAVGVRVASHKPKNRGGGGEWGKCGQPPANQMLRIAAVAGCCFSSASTQHKHCLGPTKWERGAFMQQQTAGHSAEAIG